jgi:hypothetical protein
LRSNVEFNGLLTIMNGAQVFEKNHFLETQNRATSSPMKHIHNDSPARRRARLFLVLMAAALAVATLAPVAVLAG